VITDLMTDIVSVEVYEGETAYGPTWAEPVVLLGRVQDGVSLVRDSSGDEVVSSAKVYLPAGSVVTPESLITIGDAQRSVLSVQKPHNPSHTLGYVLAVLR
jgi:hypothetical protein